MKKPATYILFIALALGGGTLIGLNNLPGDWYQGLEKPFFNPPDWIFGPVWSVLYIMIGFAGARTFVSAPGSLAMKVWIAQMALNFLWSPLFFGLQSPGSALIVILGLLATILTFVVLKFRTDLLSGLLFLPYLAWVSFATLLNVAIFYLN